MMHRTLKFAGMIAPTCLLFAGCAGEVAPDAGVAQAPQVSDSLTQGMAQGRLAMVPQHMTTTVVAADDATVAARSAELVGPKTASPTLRPQTTYADEGQRQVDLSDGLEPSAGFELTLELDKTDYMLGEPIFARTILTNVSDQALKAAPLVDPQFTYGHVIVQTPSGEVLGMKPLVEACSRGDLQVEELAAGDSRTEDFPIFFGSQGTLFDEPGTYAVQLRYRGITEESGRIDSNTIFVTVHEGGEADLDAAALAMDGEAGLFMMWGEGDHLRRGISNLQTLLDLYPDSAIADSARFALGRNLSVDFMDYSVKALREARPEAARTYLEPLVADLRDGRTGLDAGRTRDAFFFLAQDYARLGDRQLARQTVNGWLDRFGGDASAQDVVKARELLSSF